MKTYFQSRADIEDFWNDFEEKDDVVRNESDAEDGGVIPNAVSRDIRMRKTFFFK